ncbi:hypothetical protein PPYR_13940 [Photinus pyralis]|uniref:Uncharacterized protein n=1 Tax=Photinus pyralis TaxID=7054 RepID=A0A5N4A3Y2_PHOPY|nr:uncharacterized protein LOC116181190 [Photinus pyralis]KAB0791979.1 hypothetical protein PPYR_13940 [Photinus pyralis]
MPITYTWQEIQNKLTELKQEFQKVAKRIIKSELPSRESLDRNRILLTEVYNRQIQLFTQVWNVLNEDQKVVVKEQFLYFRDKTLQAFAISRCPHIVPKGLFQKIEEDNNDGELEFGNLETESITSVSNKMEETSAGYLKLASSLIKSYSGDPDNLNAFLNSLDLVKSITTTENLNLFVQFIKTRLEGKALEAIPTNANTYEEIRNALKANIKPDSSEVIEARLLALRTDRKSLETFTKEAEVLAECLKRSLIMEGTSDSKAESMVVRKMVETCRKSARSDLVKSVLASGNFNKHKEVLAKFVVEISDEVTDRQILAYNRNKFHGGAATNHYRGNHSSCSTSGNYFRGSTSTNHLRGNQFRGNDRTNFNRDSNGRNFNFNAYRPNHFNQNNQNNRGRGYSKHPNIRVYHNSGNGQNPEPHPLGNN